MKKFLPFGLVVISILLVSLACQISAPTDSGMESTQIALAIQQTSIALQQSGGAQVEEPPPAVIEAPVQPTYTLYPTYTVQEVEAPPQQEQATEPPPAAPAPTATTDKLFQKVTTDRTVFYCVPSSGPTTLTITVEMSDIDRGATLFWRLEGKNSGTKLDWEIVDMRRASSTTRAYTFDANSWDGTNNFFYPPLMGESWFEFQIISNDGLERTEVFANVTFFPCNQ